MEAKKFSLCMCKGHVMLGEDRQCTTMYEIGERKKSALAIGMILGSEARSRMFFLGRIVPGCREAFFIVTILALRAFLDTTNNFSISFACHSIAM